MSDELREKVAKALWRADVKGVDERGLTWTRSLSEDHYRELADVAIAVMQPQIDAMAEQCRRVYLDWETAVQARDAAIADMIAEEELVLPPSKRRLSDPEEKIDLGHPETEGGMT